MLETGDPTPLYVGSIAIAIFGGGEDLIPLDPSGLHTGLNTSIASGSAYLKN